MEPQQFIEFNHLNSENILGFEDERVAGAILQGLKNRRTREDAIQLASKYVLESDKPSRTAIVLAEALWRDKRKQEALGMLLKADGKSPNDEFILSKLVTFLMKAKAYKAAKKSAEKLLELSGADPKTYTMLGNIHIGLMEYPEAQEYAERVTQEFPDDYLGWDLMATVMSLLNRSDKARLARQIRDECRHQAEPKKAGDRSVPGARSLRSWRGNSFQKSS